MTKKRITTLMAAFLLTASAGIMAQKAPISVKWQLCKSDKTCCNSQFIIKNISDNELGKGWGFFFNRFANKIELQGESIMDLKAVMGNRNYLYFETNDKYKVLVPGDSIVIPVTGAVAYRGNSDLPDGGHFAYINYPSNTIPVKIEVGEITPQYTGFYYREDYPDGKKMYDFNKQINPYGSKYKGNCFDIFPTPKSVTFTDKKATTFLPRAISLNVSPLAPKVQAYLREKLAANGILTSRTAKFTINVAINNAISKNPEYYELEVEKDKISIVGKSIEGALNGVKTLISVIEHSGAQVELPLAKIVDYPDLNYRGFMLDIARNFTKFEDMKHLIDLFASYKINVLQFHFNDDEAWRLEIPGLPELTEVGARKGLTFDDSNAGFLIQTYRGTGNPNDNNTSANGYYTREQFIELLKYASMRGVKIIPELETPGHARAAIVAMKNRYNKYIDVNPAKANQFILWDENDTSKYSSAQGYNDNVLCVAEPGVYRFLLKVVQEISAMYREAGLTLSTVHIGGDEVAHGSWVGSPKVKELMARENLKTNHDVAEYYVKRISNSLEAIGIKVGGWQEIASGHTDEYTQEIVPRTYGITVWSTLGKNDSIAYTLANNGYPVIFSNVNNFYFDLLYRPHQEEQGLIWGGYCDEFASWNNLPFDNYRSARYNYNGVANDLETIADGKPALQKPQNIIGVQGQLWTETIRDIHQVERYIFPKMYGLIERGWNATPAWSKDHTDVRQYDLERIAYNMKIGYRELPHLQRIEVDFHIGQPGIIVEKGTIRANAPYPGAKIHYTTDGSTPTEHSKEWTAPVPVGNAKVIKAKTFYLGKQSVTTLLELNK